MIFRKNSRLPLPKAVKRIKEVISDKKNLIGASLLSACAFMHGQDLVPAELKTTAESIRDFVKGDIAVILLTIFFVCSAIAYGFHKESQKAKMAFIAVCVACFAVAIAPSIVEKFTGMGK